MTEMTAQMRATVIHRRTRRHEGRRDAVAPRALRPRRLLMRRCERATINYPLRAAALVRERLDFVAAART